MERAWRLFGDPRYERLALTGKVDKLTLRKEHAQRTSQLVQ
jgi:hypothetical protein